MWQALINLINKLACGHDWKLISNTKIYDGDNINSLPVKIEKEYTCKKCGKFIKRS